MKIKKVQSCSTNILKVMSEQLIRGFFSPCPPLEEN